MVDEEDSAKDSTFKTLRRRRRFWWTRKKTMHDDDRARRRRRRRAIFPKLWPVVQSSIFPHKKKLLHLHVSVSQSRFRWCVSRMVSSSSRVLFARVPSISFPVRMVDGVRVTGVQHSASSSSSSSFPVPPPSTMSASDESSSKGEAVIVSEEECEIVNVRRSLSFLVFVFIFRSSSSFRRRLLNAN